MTEKDTDPPKKAFLGITLSDSLLLATLPFFAYLFTFVYQAGYLDAFKLPYQFMSINIVDIFNIGGKILAVFLIIIFVINYMVFFFSENGKIIPLFESRLFTVLVLFIFEYPALFLFEWNRYTYLTLLGIIISVGLLFIPPLLTKKYKGTYRYKMEMLDKRTESDSKLYWSLFEKAALFVGYKGFIAIVYFSLSLYLAYNTGKSAALNQSIFYIANTSPETVVLFMTNDKIISAPFDKNTKLIEPEFLITNISNSVDLKLQSSNIGRLKLDTSSLTPVPTPTSTPFSNQTPTVTPSPTTLPRETSTLTP